MVNLVPIGWKNGQPQRLSSGDKLDSTFLDLPDLPGAGQTLTFTHKMAEAGTWTHDLSIQDKICRISLDASQLLTGTVSVTEGSQAPITVSAGEKDWGLLLANGSLTLTAAEDPDAAAFSPMWLAPDIYVNRIPPEFESVIADHASGHFYNETRTIRWQISSGGNEVPSHIQQYEYIDDEWELTKSFNLGIVLLTGFFVRSDGLMCFVVHQPYIFLPSTRIVRYIASTAWDVDTLTESGTAYLDSTQYSYYSGLWINDTGTKLFSVYGKDSLRCFDAYTPWSVSIDTNPSALFTLQNTSEYAPGFCFVDNGAGLMVYPSIHEDQSVSSYHRLDTAWDLTTVQSAMQVELTSVSPEASTDGRCVRWSSDGMRFFVLSGSAIRQYDVNNAWELEGASLSGELHISTMRYFDFNADGSKLYTMLSGRVIAQRNISPAWDINLGLPLPTPDSTLDLSAEITETDLLALSIFDDTRFFVLAGGSQAELRQYSMSGGDIGTGSHVEALDISAETSQARAMHMSSEKLLLLQGIGSVGNRILCYTAPDNELVTASYDDQYLDMMWGESTRDIRFNNDGTLMYILCKSTLHCISIPAFKGRAFAEISHEL